MDKAGRSARSPWQMPTRAWKQILIRVWRESSDDNIGLIAAGVAFYGFLAIVPLLTATVLTYGIFAAPETVLQHIRALASALPDTVAVAIGEQLLALVQASDSKKTLGVLAALAIALFGARNGAGAIITALNIAYEESEKRSFLALNATSLALTAAAVLAAIFAALLAAGVSALPALMPSFSDPLLVTASIATYGLFTLAGAFAAAVLYRYGPSRDAARWIWLTPGSLLSALLWLGLSLGFGAYVSNIGKFDATYGSLGAVVGLLTWLYLSSYALLIGGELNSEFEHQTAQDSTKGSEKPIGERRAWVADHVASDESAESNDGSEIDTRTMSPRDTAPRETILLEKKGRAANRGLSVLSWVIGLATVAGVARWFGQGLANQMTNPR